MVLVLVVKVMVKIALVVTEVVLVVKIVAEVLSPAEVVLCSGKDSAGDKLRTVKSTMSCANGVLVVNGIF